MTHLLDTDVLVHAMRGPARTLADRLRDHRGKLAVSTISLMEVTFGAHRSTEPAREFESLEDVLPLVQVLPFDQNAAEHAGEIRARLARKGTPIGAYDALIAGQARSRGLVVATGNVREFKRVPGLLVENWR